MDPNFLKFVEDMSKDKEMQEQFKEKISDLSLEAKEAIQKFCKGIGDFAQERGYELKFHEIMQATFNLNLEDLEKVSGGRMYVASSGAVHSDCACVIGGGGTADEYQGTCACVVGGGGDLTEAGEELTKANGNFYPLFCIIGGEGAYLL